MALGSPSSLKAQMRTHTGTRAAKKLRFSGQVPAVLYGHGEETLNLSVDAGPLEHAIEEGQHVLTLDMPAGEQQALIKEIQYDTYHVHVLHVDFTRIAFDEDVEVEVPIELHGSVEQGVVEQNLYSLPVACRADRIPEKLRVEVGHMEIGQVRHVSDIELPDGVRPGVDPEAVVVAIHAPQVEEVVEEAEEVPAEPEVIGEEPGKEEEAGEPEDGSGD